MKYTGKLYCFFCGHELEQEHCWMLGKEHYYFICMGCGYCSPTGELPAVVEQHKVMVRELKSKSYLIGAIIGLLLNLLWQVLK